MKVITIPEGKRAARVSRLVDSPKRRDKNNKYAQNLIVRSLRKPKDAEVTAFMMFDFVCQKVCENFPKNGVLESIRRIKSCRT